MKYLTKGIDFVIQRLAWACTMMMMALIGLVCPQALVKIMDEFDSTENPKKANQTTNSHG